MIYNKEVEEGCHITSMAGTWMSIVEVLVECELKTHSFSQKIPKEWIPFKINFRNQILKSQSIMRLHQMETKFVLGETNYGFTVNDATLFEPNSLVTVLLLLAKIYSSLALFRV
jgi:maltose phosphorylase